MNGSILQFSFTNSAFTISGTTPGSLAGSNTYFGGVIDLDQNLNVIASNFGGETGAGVQNRGGTLVFLAPPFMSFSVTSNGDNAQTYAGSVDGQCCQDAYGENTQAGTWSAPTTLPSPPPTTLFTPQQKAYYGNLSNLADALGAGLGVSTLATGVLRGSEGSIMSALDTLGLLTGQTHAQQQFAQQVLNSGNLALAGFFVGSGCTFGIETVVACGVALAGAELAVLSDFAGAIRADPSDPNYQSVFAPTIDALPMSITGVCSSLDATAAATPYALDQTNEWLDALYVTNNRYQTALAAGDVASATLQYATFQNYLGLYNAAAQTAGTDLSCFSNLLSSVGLGLDLPTAQDETGELAFLQTQDPSLLDSLFSPYGFTDAELTTLVDEAEADPPALPTETIVEDLADAGQRLNTASTTPVPEPGSFWLLATGMTSFAIILLITGLRRSI
jgi:hypothetical protein